MMGRLLAIAASAALAGCTALTPTDLRFLELDGGVDSSLPDCSLGQTNEIPPLQCHDGCDNDGDGLTDCDDEEDCAHFCCESMGGEDLACNDQCDNDLDGLIDCDDLECEEADNCRTETPAESDCDLEDPDLCCSNGEDDDGDGVTDCADPDCTRSDRCCGTVSSFTDPAGGGFDGAYWEPFGGRDAPTFEEVEGASWLTDWRSGSEIGGVASARPVDLSFGLTIELTTEVVTAEPCIDPEACPSYTGIALGPSPAPPASGEPARNLSVLVTSSNHVAVVRAGRVLHRIGIEPAPGAEVSPVRRIRVDLLPAAGAGGVNGFRMELRVPNGREVCHDDATSVGCRDEELWSTDELVLLAEDNILDAGGHGSYVMVIGRGAGVHLGDYTDHTVAVQVRGCTNPAAWQPGPRASYVGSEVLCWAVGALGSPSVAALPGDTFGMALHGTTVVPVPSDYGRNNWSLGWLTTDDVGGAWGDPFPSGHIRREPIDTQYDLNCLGDLDWSGDECEAVPQHPVDVPGGCAGQDSHRSPQLVPGSMGEHRILFAESIVPDERQYLIKAARFTPSAWTWEEMAHVLTPEDISLAVSTREYQSVRDPVAVCRDLSAPAGSCPDGEMMVILVAEAVEGGAWAGDDIVYVPYSMATGFESAEARAILTDDDRNPLRGRALSEPWVMWEPDTERFFLWVTSGTLGGESQVDLLLAPCEGCVESPPDHPLVRDFVLYEGSPVLSSEDLELILRPAEGDPWIDCSGGCDIGGVSALRLPNPTRPGEDQLHLWVGVTEKPASGDLATWGIHQLVQPFGLPGE